jgi:beta-glucosidase
MESSSCIYKDPNSPIEARVKDLLSRMTLKEKVAQMTQIERSVATPHYLQDLGIGILYIYPLQFICYSLNDSMKFTFAVVLLFSGFLSFKLFFIKLVDYLVGSVMTAGGSAPFPNAKSSDWADMVDWFQKLALQSRLGIPIIYGIDAVHGNNGVYGTTIFPHNVGLGATR